MVAVRNNRIYRSTRTYRTIGIIGVLIYGWWLLSSFRTMQIGNQDLPMLVLLGTIYVVPVAILTLLGMNLRKVFGYSLLMMTVALVAAVIWASTEEYLVMRAAETETRQEQAQHVQRWWPFQHHEIVYVPEQGWVGQE